MSLLTTLLIIFLVLLGISIWMLSVPLECQIDVDTRAKQKLKLQFAWLYGLVKFSPSGAGKSEPGKSDLKEKTKKPHKKKAKAKADKTESRQSKDFFFAMVRSKGFIARVLRLIKDFFCVVEFRDSRLFCRFGLDNPANTGQSMGIIAPLFFWLQSGPLPNAHFEPDFDQETLVIDAATRIRIVPIRYVAVFLSFLLSTDIWRGVYSGFKASRA